MRWTRQSTTFMAYVLSFMLAVVVTPVIASGDEHDNHEHEEQSEHLTMSEHLRLLHGWTRATNRKHARVFMEIENIGDEPVHITGGSTPVSQQAYLVWFSMVDGQGQYERLDAIPVIPKRTLNLAPRGLALAVEGLSQPLAKGDSFPLTLTTDHGDIAMSIAVEAADAKQHSHAGHAH